MFNVDLSGLDRIIKKLESAADINEIDKKVKAINKDASAYLDEKGEVIISGLNKEELDRFKENFLS